MTKKIILKSIALLDWKAQNRLVEFNHDGGTTISGRNGSGKSTIIKAWNWLLTGYTDPYTNRNSELYDNRMEMTPETPLAIVKAVISIDGYDYKLERRARCAFTRRRGSKEYEKARSDEYTILIDEVETSATDFKSWIEANIAPESALVFCLDGNYFCTLALEDKAKARKVLESIVGEILPSDFKGDYSNIEDLLSRGYTAENIIERSRKSIVPLKDRLAAIDTLKDANNATVEEYSLIDYDAISKKIEEYNEEIRRIDGTILGNGESIQPLIEERDKIFGVINKRTTDLESTKGKYLSEFNAKVRDIKSKIADVESYNRNIDTKARGLREDIDGAKVTIAHLEKMIERYEGLRMALLNKRNEIKALMFTEDKCPMCGAELSPEVLESKMAAFNEEKSKKIAAVVAEGRANNVSIEESKKKIEYYNELIAKNEEELSNIEEKKSVEELYNELAALNAAFVPFESTKEYNDAIEEINSLKASIPTIPTNDNEALTTLKSNILSEIAKLNKELGKKDIIERCSEKNASLDTEKDDIVLKIAYYEGCVDAAIAYMQEKADIVSFRINERLDGCKIDMYSRQKDGSLVGDCVITDNRGVKYSTLNNSARIRVAIEMQKLFMRYFGISLPIFVDESSVFDSASLPKCDDGQMVYLFASDDELKVE